MAFTKITNAGFGLTTGTLVGVAASFSSTVSVGGTLTYEDVTNVDSVGLITARNGIEVTDKGVQVGTGATVDSAGDNILTFLTNGSERVRVTSGGNIGINSTNPGYLLDIASGSASMRLNSTSTSTLVITSGESNDARIEFGDLANNDTGYIYYDNSDDSMQFATNGSNERLRITSAGRVGIGTASPNSELEIKNASTSAGFTITTGNTTEDGYINFSDGSTAGQILYKHSDNYMRFYVNAAERMRIDSSGNVGIVNSSPSNYSSTGRNLVIGSGSGAAGLTIASGATNTGNIYFAAGSTGDDQVRGQIRYNHSTEAMDLYTDASYRLRIDGSGRFLIGSSVAASAGDAQYALLQIAGNTAGASGSVFALKRGEAASAMSNGDSLGTIVFTGTTGGDFATILGSVDGSPSGSVFPGRIVFSTTASGASSPTERMRIDSSGRLLVGTSSNFVRGNIQAVDSGGGEITIGRNDTTISSGNDIGHLFFASNDANTSAVASANISCHADADHTGDSAPTRLTFSTTATSSTTSTERMRITNDGYFHASNTGSISAGTNYHSITSNVNTYRSLAVINSSNASGDGTYYSFVGTNANNTSSYHFVGATQGVDKILIYGNGNVVNVNNSYGSLSDVKLKENIIDASSQWDDIKDIRVRKYNFIEGQTHTQIGVVAQEIETVSPGLVTESPDRDEDGNDLGTVTKSVNYSVLYMKAVKALQEAMDRIETLETKVAALEG